MKLVPPPPVEVGAPARFTSWRPGQWETVIALLSTKVRTTGLVLPTGFGKTLTYVVRALLPGRRTAILTRTKALQDQLLREFSSAGLVDLRGQREYECLAVRPGGILSDYRRQSVRPTPVSEGPCKAGVGCSLKQHGCPYYDAVARAKGAQLLVTNYAAWLAQYEMGTGLGRWEVLVCDEAHRAPELLVDFLKVTLPSLDVHRYGDPPPEPEQVQSWISWAKAARTRIRRELTGWDPDGESATPKASHERQRLQGLERACDRLIECDPDAWFVAREGIGYVFAPLEASRYAEQYLFRSIPSIILSSATLSAKTCALLGQPDATLISAPSPFPLEQRPVIHIKTCRIDHKTDNSSAWLPQLDHILRTRADRKGIIHTGSYERAQLIYGRSDYRERMIRHGAGDLALALRKFAGAPPGAILLSPSVTEGYDFPGAECEYQVIVKAPFLDMRDPVLAAQTERDPDYPYYLAMQTLVQIPGRGMRSAWDRCECVAPETRILTADLRWVAAGDLAEGDALLGFDARGAGRGYRRRWRESYVVKSLIREMPRRRVILTDGEVICTPNHPWLVRPQGHSTHRWCRTDALKPGLGLARFWYPWTEPEGYDLGWLAGFTEGEGCLALGSGKRNQTVTSIFLSQNFGDTLFDLEARLKRARFDFHTSMRPEHIGRRGGKPSSGLGCSVRIKGGFAEHVRFLGMVRPNRLLQKFLSEARDQEVQMRRLSKVVSVETLPDGPISSLQTSTQTYIAEGLGAHNTFILDDHANWFIRQYRRFCPPWFLQAYRSVAIIPPPLPKL